MDGIIPFCHLRLENDRKKRNKALSWMRKLAMQEPEKYNPQIQNITQSTNNITQSTKNITALKLVRHLDSNQSRIWNIKPLFHPRKRPGLPIFYYN